MANVTRQRISSGGAIEMELMTVNLDRAIRAAEEIAGRKAIEALAGAMYREALDIMADSKPEVPVDLGVLRASGHVQKPEIINGVGISVRLGYGGAAAPYALKQHEDQTLRHTTGKAKFLSDPLKRHLDGMADRLARDMRRHLGR